MTEPLVEPTRPRVSGRVHALGRARDRALPHRAARRPHRGGAARRRPGARAADRVRPDHERAGRAPTATHWIEVGPRGTVQTFTWVAQPAAGQARARQAVRVRADPARRRRHRDAARGRLRRAPTRSAIGSRVAPAVAGRAHRARSPTSRRGSRSATARSPSRRRCTCRPRTSSRSPASPSPIRLEYELTAGVATARYLEGLGRGQDHRRRGRRRATTCTRRRAAPIRRRASRPRSRSRCATRGVITTFCVVNIPGLSELAPEIPYVSAQILLDGANNTLLRADPRRRGRRRAHGHAGEGEVGRRAEARPHLDPVVGADRRTRRRLREVQGLPLMRDVAVVSFVCSRRSRATPSTTRSR